MEKIESSKTILKNPCGRKIPLTTQKHHGGPNPGRFSLVTDFVAALSLVLFGNKCTSLSLLILNTNRNLSLFPSQELSFVALF
jgi:hypothetical protein